jgi:hypothetical protein
MEHHTTPERSSSLSLPARCLRLAVGLVLLALVVGFFASGYAPRGPLGEVRRDNQGVRIDDASPLFYTEVENMQELEAGLAGSPDTTEEADQNGDGAD